MKNNIPYITLIDDDRATNLYNRRIMEKRQVVEKVEVFSSALKALEYFSSEEFEKPDLVLLDINMPAMDGWDFLNALEELDHPSLKELRIFMLSASSNPDDVKRAKGYNQVSGFLNKPLDTAKLVELFNSDSTVESPESSSFSFG